MIGGIGLGVWGGFKRRIVTSLIGLILLGSGVVALGMALRHYSSWRWGRIARWPCPGHDQRANHGTFQAVIAPDMQGTCHDPDSQHDNGNDTYRPDGCRARF